MKNYAYAYGTLIGSIKATIEMADIFGISSKGVEQLQHCLVEAEKAESSQMGMTR